MLFVWDIWLVLGLFIIFMRLKNKIMMVSRYFIGYVYNEMFISIVLSFKIDLEWWFLFIFKYMYMYYILEFILDVIGLSCY